VILLIVVLMPAWSMNGCMMGMHMTGDHAHLGRENHGVAVARPMTLAWFWNSSFRQSSWNNGLEWKFNFS
jgi:hypothetical protein